MLNLQDYTCPVCGKPFAPGDDVVVCPECGAPHHRECWKQSGRCAFAASHGTAAQWRPFLKKEDDDAWVCRNCGTVNPLGSPACSKCGCAFEEPEPPRPEEQQPPVDPAVFAPPYTPYGEVPSDGVVDGEAAMDMATFLGPRAGYYLPRFQYMEQSRNPLSWNWAAALFPVEWLLYRKMRRLSALMLAIFLVLSLPSLAMIVLCAQTVVSDPDALRSFLSRGEISAESIPVWLLVFSQIASFLSLSLRGVMGIQANDWYRQHTKRLMGKIREECPEPLVQRYALAKKGGVSVVSVVLYLIILTAVFAFAGAAAILTHLA